MPDVLISSYALRAETTAKSVASALDLPLRVEKRLYPFSRTEVATVIGEQDAQVQHLMLVGHNPGISYLAASLGAEEAIEMPTAAVVSMQFEVDSWAAVLQSQASSYWFDYPKKPAD
ncbi:MAG: hypothetical protein OXT49_02555, partial [Gammaproteobacteria bacterium]|nr:hypothetical protein [Gammaproteobacteria bacterium]